MSTSTAWFKTRGRPELGVMTVIVADLRSPAYSPWGLLRSDSFHPADHAAYGRVKPQRRGASEPRSTRRCPNSGVREGELGWRVAPRLRAERGDIVAKEHWSQNGFVNTDLDVQLRQHGIRQVVPVGMIANTCIEATSRYAMELGYHVTLVKDATAAFNPDRMHAAHVLNGPNFAHAIVTTAELLAALPAGT